MPIIISRDQLALSKVSLFDKSKKTFDIVIYLSNLTKTYASIDNIFFAVIIYRSD